MATAPKKQSTIAVTKPTVSVADIQYTPTSVAAPTYNAPANNVEAYVAPLQTAKYTDAGDYISNYSGQINDALGKITNRQEFSYNPLEDASYRSLAKIYTAEGNRAAKSTMADAAALNGGYGTSYAVTAAQQARNQYNQQLMSLVPGLEQNAYERYRGNFEMNMSALNALRDADESEYNRYRDRVGDNQWKYQMDYQKDRDAVSDAQWKYNMDYNAYRDTVNDAQWKYSSDYNAYRDSVQDANDAYARQVAATQADWDNYWNGKNYNLDVKNFNLDRYDTIESLKIAKKSKGSSKSGGGGSSSGVSGGSNLDKIWNEASIYVKPTTNGNGWMLVPASEAGKKGVVPGKKDKNGKYVPAK